MTDKKDLLKKSKTAFSLLELSIVILIVSILIVGSMSASVVAINNARYKVTKDRTKEIYKAMGNYLLVNKALPCPASIIALKTSSSYGTAGIASGVCNGGSGVYVGTGTDSADLVYGTIPTQTLGLSADMAEDGFGSKFTYIVAAGFTNPVLAGITSGFGSINPATGFITVKENLDLGTTFQVDTNDAIFVIISHGSNKYGAFNNNSSEQNAVSTDTDEQNNYATTFSGTTNGTADFYDTNSYFTASSVSSDSFDDVVFYKTRNAMLMDFNALSLIVCNSNSTNYGDYTVGSTTFTWPETYYDQIVSSNSATTCDAALSGYGKTVTSPTKRCGAFGVWQAGTINACTN